MGKIGDLWVKLGLKKDEFDRGIDNAQKKTTSFADGFTKVKGLAVAAWAAIGAAAVKMADKFAHQSQRLGDLWDNTVAGMKGAWNQFTTSLTSMNWENLGSRMKNAFNAARESNAAHDLEGEVKRSIDIRQAQMKEELAILQTEMRNQKNSYEERARYAQEYLDKVKPLYEQESKLRRDIYLADTNEYLTNAGLSNTQANRDALVRFMSDVAPNEELLKALDQYNKKVQGKKFNLDYNQNNMLDTFFENNRDWNTNIAGALATYYLSSGDEVAEKVTQAIVNKFSAEGAFADETRKIQQMLNSADYNANKITGPSTPKVKEDKEDMLKLIKEETAAVNEEFRALQEEEEEYAELDRSMGQHMMAMLGMDGVIDKQKDELVSLGDQALETAKKIEEAAENEKKALQELAENFQNAELDAAIASYENAFQYLTDSLAGLENFDADRLVAVMIEPFADMATRMGEYLISFGAGLVAVQEGFESMNPYVMIAAGGALIALGAAAKSAVSSLARGTGGGTTTAYETPGATGNIRTSNELTVYVKGTIKGSDIVLSGQKTQANWNR